MTEERQPLLRARRLVVKVGSRLLATEPDLPQRLAEEFAHLRGRGLSVVLVSSGAIAVGCQRLGYPSRPTDMPSLQAAASAGQLVLMRRYDEAFGAHGLVPAQVLLTHADLADRERLNNARAALGALLDAGAVPIINENDAVATDELRFGDNDQLAAMVAPLTSSDALILLTDVEGVLDEAGARISVMNAHDAFNDMGSKRDRIGTGGMASKLDAARKARRAGAAVIIGNGHRPRVIRDIMNGDDVGTYFAAIEPVLRARQHWIAYTLRPSGAVLIDSGAARALEERQSSLLPVGVLGVRGEFHPGDSVQILGPGEREIGRGLARLGSLEVARVAGKRGSELEAFRIGGRDVVVIHRDDLVISTS